VPQIQFFGLCQRYIYKQNTIFEDAMSKKKLLIAVAGGTASGKVGLFLTKQRNLYLYRPQFVEELWNS
jgi:hypothetical protein